MAVTRQTISLAAGARLRLNRQVDDLTRRLAQGWGVAWAELGPLWEKAAADLIAEAKDGAWPDRATVLRAEASRAALRASLEALQSLADAAGGSITGALPDLTSETALDVGRIIASQYPGIAGDQAVIAQSFNRVTTENLSAIIARTAGQVTALTYPISAEATASMSAELIRGVALGSNPRVAARRMVARVEGRFNGGLHRAENIARTEMLDVHRRVGQASELENADVLAGWTWLAKLDSRTCPSCLALHGSVHPLAEFGPTDHQSGRCARMPKTKTWAQLGFDVPGGEPDDVLPDARQWWADLPADQQVATMGGSARRAELLRTGAVSWDDLATLRPSPAWRDSYAPTPLGDLERIAAAAA